MRIHLQFVALVGLSALALAGCQSDGTGMASSRNWYGPSWSLASLNPFSSAPKSTPKPYPERPSNLASPASTTPPSTGYAAAGAPGSDRAGYPGTAGGRDLPSESYAGRQYSYPSTQASSLAGYDNSPGAAAGRTSAATPQTGYYDPTALSRLASRSGTAEYGSSDAGSPYPVATGSNAYSSLARSSDRYGSASYDRADAGGAYGGSSAPATRYEMASERYGLNGPQTDRTGDVLSRQAPAADSYSAARDQANSRYAASQTADPRSGSFAGSDYGARAAAQYENDSESGNAMAADSRYSAAAGSSWPNYATGASNYGSANHYSSSTNDTSSTGSNWLGGDRYARADTSPQYPGGYNSYRNGQFSSSPGDTSWNPGDTGYHPGQTDYEPGATGYNPPGVSRYRSPAGSYVLPGNSIDPATPYLPGSTKLYSPRTSTAPDRSGSPTDSSTDRADVYSSVIPAGHLR